MFTKPGPATSTRATSPPAAREPLGELLGDRARRLAQRLRQQHRGVAREVPVVVAARRLERELGRRTRRRPPRRAGPARGPRGAVGAQRAWRTQGGVSRNFRQGIRGLASPGGSRRTSVSPLARVDQPLADRALERERLARSGEPAAVALELGHVAAQLLDPRLRRAQVLAQRPPGAQPDSPSTSASTSATDDDTDREPHAHRAPPRAKSRP